MKKTLFATLIGFGLAVATPALADDKPAGDAKAEKKEGDGDAKAEKKGKKKGGKKKKGGDEEKKE